MTNEQKEIVAKASVPMTIANGFRWFFVIIALLLLLFIFFGGKIWSGVTWYEAFTQNAYMFLFWDILLMLCSTIVKMIFTARYNHIVKNL